MKSWLFGIVSFLLWTHHSTSEKVCRVPALDFGEVVNGLKMEYIEDDRVQFKCHPGYELEGPDWAICTKKEWVPSPKCLAPCRITVQQLDARNMLLSDGQRRGKLVKNGEIASFKCREGFVIVSPSVIKCEDGKMDFPACIATVCRVPAIEFGEVVSGQKMEYLEQDRVQFKCHPGYDLVGSDWVACKDRAWVPSPKCLAPCRVTVEQLDSRNLLLSNGKRSVVLVKNGQKAGFVCRKGYIIISEAITTCQNGKMDFPACVASVCKVPAIDFGDVVKGHKIEYVEHDRVQFKCHAGYELEGSDLIECKGKIWVPSPKCLAPCRVTKQQLDARNLLLADGQRHSELVRNGEIAEFMCRKGYVILSPSVIKCVNGIMDFPSCVASVPGSEISKFDVSVTTSGRRLVLSWKLSTPVICTAPDIDNGSLSPVQSQYMLEGRIYVKCNKGFKLENLAIFSKCTKYGWSPNPKCIPKHCDFPHILNGRLSWSYTYYSDEYFPRKEGKRIDFRCNPGYLAINRKIWHRVICSKYGWAPEPHCYRQCLLPKTLLHGHVNENPRNVFIEGDNILYSCDEGYRSEFESPKANCTKNGWEPIPHCISVS
ncbi:hypothetical protein lerEdw1_020160 [Lerista edwardsae]|nr:hypothetical protein lerEdw1_020160 [Lerista edwardsae]